MTKTRWRSSHRAPADEVLAAVSDHDAIASIARVLARAMAGDVEERVGALDAQPEVAALGDRVDALLDVVDAFVRESGAALAAASEGRFYRQVLTRGMPGVFAVAAERINRGQEQMQSAALALAAKDTQQRKLAETATDISAQVAGSATELGASAAALAASAAVAVEVADRAQATVDRLAQTSHEIEEAARFITRIAAQTRLLSLNATIESARAGEAGRGFAVVANEVKELAEETTRTSADITAQVQAANAAAVAAGQAIDAIAGVIREVDASVSGISEAAGGPSGLSQLAESLHNQIGSIGER